MIRFLLMSWLCWWLIVSQCSARDLRNGMIKNYSDSRSADSADDRNRESPQISIFVTSRATFVIPGSVDLEPREIPSEGSPKEEKYRFGMIGKFAKKTCNIFGLSCTFLVYTTSDTASKTSTTFPKTLLCGLCVNNKNLPEYHAHQCQHIPQSSDSVVVPPPELILPRTNSGLQNSDGMENASATAPPLNQVEDSPTVAKDNVLHQRSNSLNNSNDAYHQSLDEGSENNHSQAIRREGGDVHNNRSNVDQLSQERRGNNQDDHDKSSLVNDGDEKSDGRSNADQPSQEGSGNNRDDHDKSSLVDGGDKKKSDDRSNADQFSQEESGNNRTNFDKSSSFNADNNEDTRDSVERKHSKLIPGTYDDVHDDESDVPTPSREMSRSSLDDRGKSPLVAGSDVEEDRNNVHPVDRYNEKEIDKPTSSQHYNGDYGRQYSGVGSDSIKNLDARAKYGKNNNQVNHNHSDLIDDRERKNSDQRPAPKARRKPESVPPPAVANNETPEDSPQSPRTGVQEQPHMVRTRSNGKPSLSRSDTRDSNSSREHEDEPKMNKCGRGGCNFTGSLFNLKIRERKVGDETIKEYDVDCCPFSCTGCGCFGGSSLLDDGGFVACCFPCCSGIFRFNCLTDFIKSIFNRPKKNKEKKKEKEKGKK